jgi:hypothetical protein
LNGISTSQWNGNSSVSYTFELAVAASTGIPSITANNITVLNVTALPIPSESLVQESIALQSQSVSVVASYDIFVYAQLAGFATPAAASNGIANSLTASVNSGAFTSTLQTIARQQGVPALQSVTSTQIAASTPTSLPTKAPSAPAATNSVIESLSTAGIAGIVVAGFVILIVLSLGLFSPHLIRDCYTRCRTACRRSESTVSTNGSISGVAMIDSPFHKASAAATSARAE